MAGTRASRLNDQVLRAAGSVSSNPHLRRLAQDDDLRHNAIDAYRAARKAYGRISTGKSARALLDDKKLRRELEGTVRALRDAREVIAAPSRKRHRLRTMAIVATIGTGAALALSEGLRDSVLDALFGDEEEFEYTSQTSANGSTTVVGEPASS